MKKRILLSILGLMVFWGLSPQPALAYIPHLDPKEGFFIRQVSYLFFLIAMVIFYFELNQEKFKKYRGLRLLAWASLLFALWNLNCFMGQFFALNLDGSLIVGSAGSFTQRLHTSNILTWLYYLTNLDYLLLVPAFCLFYLGLRVFSQELKIG